MTSKRRKDIEHILSTLEDENYEVKNLDFKRKFLKITSGNIEDKLTATVTTKMKKDELLDKYLQEELQNKISDNPRYDELFKTRQKLPCYDIKDQILDAIWNNQVTLISGATGCGKTTQIPQYVLDKFILDGNGSQARIICTQPRRISALSVCERVADERAEKVGKGSIGYHIRLEK